jgi:hypothetical protein
MNTNFNIVKCEDQREFAEAAFLHYFHQEVPDSNVWNEGNNKLTAGHLVEAFAASKNPVFSVNFEELLYIVARELPCYGLDFSLTRNGAHHLTDRKPADGVIKLWKPPTMNRAIAFKDAMFMLTGDNIQFAENCTTVQVYQLCGSPLCMSPSHLALGPKSEAAARKQCQVNTTIDCAHGCLRGLLAGPPPPPSSSKRQAARSGSEFIEPPAREVAHHGKASCSLQQKLKVYLKKAEDNIHLAQKASKPRASKRKLPCNKQ